MPLSDADKSAAHRAFAIDFNNAAWDLVEASERTPDQTQRMLLLAHAACLHWQEAGKPINHQRALSLLAHAHAAAGQGPLAVQFATQCLALSEQRAADQTPFDRAAAAACMTSAQRCLGDQAAAAAWEQRTRQLASQLDDPNDAQVVLSLMTR